jgi:hypothetical protein
MKLLTAMLTAAAVLAAPCAYATTPSDDDATGMCAKVKKTTDGWLALRKGPTTSAPLIVKLTTDEELVVQQMPARGASWVKVGITYYDDRNPNLSTSYRGWAHRDHLKLYECGC